MRFLQGLPLLAAALLVAPVCRAQPAPDAPVDLRGASAIVRFSPDGGCAQAVIDALDKAKSSVLVQAYSFTSAPIAKALVSAQSRGVDVRAILDKSNRRGKYSAADFLLHAGIPVYIDSAHAIAHNKIMIVDGRVVITGSFNFTKAAETKNAENLLVIDSPRLAAKYAENWEAHLAHSVEYAGRRARGR